MTEREENGKTTFLSMSPAQRVRAILGGVLEPVSRDFALELSGINYVELDEKERAKIDGVFRDPGIETTEGEVTKFRLSEEERTKLEKEVDMEEINAVIADRLWSFLNEEGLI